MIAERRLGTGVTKAALYARGGQRKIADLPDASLMKYSRTQSEVSAATIVIPTAGHASCCSVLGQIASWGHEVVIFRDGRRVWEGPVVQPSWRQSSVTITARDVMVKPGRSGIREAVPVPTADYVVNQALYDLQRSYAGDDPNVLAHLQVIGLSTGPLTTRDVAVGDGVWLDQITELVKAGLRWTVVGRRIILWPATAMVGRTHATLLPAQHMTAEVEVVEDGMGLLTSALAANDAQEVGYSPVTAVDPFYGRVENVVSSSAVGVPALTSVAAQTQQAAYPAPLTLRVPQGSVLSCDAPFDFSELVPGVIMPVEVVGTLCRDVRATQQIESVEVTVDGNGEQVAITLTQPSGALS